jgi:hypothetical protein
MGLCYNLKITRPQREILQAYANFADEFGVCWPANDTIARMCDITPRHVKRIKLQLYELDLMWVVENPQGGRDHITLYQLNVAALQGAEHPELQKPLKGDIIESPFSVELGRRAATGKGDISHAKEDISSTKGDVATSKSDTATSRKGDGIASPDPSLETVISEPSIQSSSHTSGPSRLETERKTNSDSLRSSGVSSRRSEDASKSNQTQARVEAAKRRYSQFRNSKRDILDMMLNSELGQDDQARAEFEAWRAVTEPESTPHSAGAAG